MSLFDLLHKNKIKPLIAQRFPLAQARQAHELLGRGGVTGKIVLVSNVSGVESFATGTPLSVVNGTAYGDNAGLGNGVGTGSFADRIGNPKENIPSRSELSSTGYSEFALNPGAYALPTGLTFGNAGRDSVNNRLRLNIDMGILKHFAIQENKMFEFRFEAFNVFNHPEWAGFPNFMSCTGGANNSTGDPSCLGPGRRQSVRDQFGAPRSCRTARCEVHLLALLRN